MKSNKDQIDKAIWGVMEVVRDDVIKNIVSLAGSNKIQLRRIDLEGVVAAVKTTMEGTYQAGAANLRKIIDRVIAEEIAAAKESTPAAKKSKT